MKIRPFRDWKIIAKLRLITLVSIGAIAVLMLFLLLPLHEKRVIQEKKIAVKNAVEVAYGILRQFDARAQAGEITVSQAQRAAVLTIRNIRFQGKEYFWINDLAPTLIMHATMPELEGKDLRGTKDPDGKSLFQEFVRLGKEQGGGFLDYLWPRPGSSEPVPKLSYVQLYSPWGWIIGSGIYIDDVKSEINSIRRGVLAGTGLLALALLGLAHYVGNSVVKPLRRVILSLREIAHGEADLTRRIEVASEDESGDLAHAFNCFVERLRAIMAEVAAGAGKVALAAAELEGASDLMARGVKEVAVKAARVASAEEEMAATSADVALSCSAAADASRQANDRVINGAVVVEETVLVMNRIAERVKATAMSVDTLGCRSDQIGEIVDTIQDIADQTNLLALNAAIEAARAGDHGRGFAVVAGEVRTLAQRTTRATMEIAQMIQAIQQETSKAVASMEAGVREVESGTFMAARSGEALDEILKRINTVTHQINQIAAAAAQQTCATVGISRDIGEITDGVQRSSLGAVRSAEASFQMAGLADRLQQLVGHFKVMS